MTMPPQNQNPGYGQSSSPGHDAGYNPAPGGPGMGGAVPKPVEMLKKLGFAQVGLTVISAILSFLLSNAVADAVTRQGGNAAATAGSSTAGGIGGAIFGIIIAILYVVLAMQVAKHNNPSRIILGVLGILGILGGLFGLLGILGFFALGVNPLLTIVYAVLTIAGLIVSILIVVNAFNKQTAAWTQR